MIVPIVMPIIKATTMYTNSFSLAVSLLKNFIVYHFLYKASTPTSQKAPPTSTKEIAGATYTIYDLTNI